MSRIKSHLSIALCILTLAMMPLWILGCGRVDAKVIDRYAELLEGQGKISGKIRDTIPYCKNQSAGLWKRRYKKKYSCSIEQNLFRRFRSRYRRGPDPDTCTRNQRFRRIPDLSGLYRQTLYAPYSWSDSLQFYFRRLQQRSDTGKCKAWYSGSRLPRTHGNDQQSTSPATGKILLRNWGKIPFHSGFFISGKSSGKSPDHQTAFGKQFYYFSRMDRKSLQYPPWKKTPHK